MKVSALIGKPVYIHKGCVQNARMATREKKITQTQSQDEKNTLSFDH